MHLMNWIQKEIIIKQGRKESNERLISKKGLIGRVIGFTPMIGLFVCYLIVPLVVIGLSAMKDLI